MEERLEKYIERLHKMLVFCPHHERKLREMIEERIGTALYLLDGAVRVKI